jgi:hypothetical protein
VFDTGTPKYFVYVSVEPLIIVRSNYIFFTVILIIVRTKCYFSYVVNFVKSAALCGGLGYTSFLDNGVDCDLKSSFELCCYEDVKCIASDVYILWFIWIRVCNCDCHWCDINL